MSGSDVLATLEGELDAFPVRAPAPDLYRHMLGVAERIALAQRPALAAALRTWIAARTEPRTMIAVNLVQELAMSELQPDLEQLRDDIRKRKAFLPYYTRWVDEALAKL